MAPSSAVIAGVIALTAVVGATIAVCLGKIDASAYTGIVGAFGGIAAGTGAHAAGVKQGQP